MRIFLVPALLLVVAARLEAAEWRLVLTDEQEDLGRILAFADVSDIRREGETLHFWLDMRIERPPVTADGSRARIEADCGRLSYRASHASYYVGDRWLKPGPDEPFQVTAPGTNMNVLLGNMCAGRFLSGTVDPVAYTRRFLARE